MILVIDPDPGVAEGLKALFRANGYQSETAHDAATGYRRARALRPALISLNLLLPHGSAHGLLERLEADAELRSVPVLVLTGGPSARGRRARVLHADHAPDGFIERSVRPEHILDAVSEMLR